MRAPLVGQKAPIVETEPTTGPTLDDIRETGWEAEGLRLLESVLLVQMLDIAAGIGIRELVATSRRGTREADSISRERWESNIRKGVRN